MMSCLQSEDGDGVGDNADRRWPQRQNNPPQSSTPDKHYPPYGEDKEPHPPSSLDDEPDPPSSLHDEKNPSSLIEEDPYPTSRLNPSNTSRPQDNTPKPSTLEGIEGSPCQSSRLKNKLNLENNPQPCRLEGNFDLSLTFEVNIRQSQNHSANLVHQPRVQTPTSYNSADVLTDTASLSQINLTLNPTFLILPPTPTRSSGNSLSPRLWSPDSETIYSKGPRSGSLKSKNAKRMFSSKLLSRSSESLFDSSLGMLSQTCSVSKTSHRSRCGPYRPPLSRSSSLGSQSSLDKEVVWGLHCFGETWEGDSGTMLYCG